MIRPMRRFKQQLSDAENVEILHAAKRGVLAVLGDDDYPYALPLDFVYDETNGHLYFHCAKEGHKLDAIAAHDKVSFCVMDEGELDESGDWYYFKSVIVFGRMHRIEDPALTLEKVRLLGLKYYPTPESVEVEMQKDGYRVACMELIPELITGKRVHEK